MTRKIDHINTTKDSINTMKENDIYSLILYAIYKCTKNPQYSTLSELIYTLDRENFMKLCAIFGGCVVKIPTLEELKVYSSGLLVYNLINEGKDIKEALALTELDSKKYPEVIEVYRTIDEVLKSYECK